MPDEELMDGFEPKRPTVDLDRERTITGKRLVLYAVAALLIAAAALAIGILLFGDFGSTEGRILATTALLAWYGLLTLPAAVLRDQGRAPALSAAIVVLAVAAASLTTAAVWSDEPSDALGKALAVANGWLVAAVQPATLALRRGKQDARIVHLLFSGSTVLVILLAAMFSFLIWAELDSEPYGRAFGALLVLDLLLVALQPIVARAARPRAIVHRLRISVARDGPIELTVEASHLADAASKAIRTLEGEGHRVLGLEVVASPADDGEAQGAARPCGGAASVRRGRAPRP
jgi:hypothetical protein